MRLSGEKGEAASEAYAACPCIPERQFPCTVGRRCGTPGSISKSGRKGKDQRWKKSELVVAEAEAFPVRGHGRPCANWPRQAGQSALCGSLADTVSRSAY